MQTMEGSAAISHHTRPFQTYNPSQLLSHHAHDNHIRSRLLGRLGIHQRRSPDTAKSLRCTNHETIQNRTRPIPFLEPLRDSDGQTLRTATYPTTFGDSKGSIDRAVVGTRVVRFSDDVLVVPIPSRHAYSDRIKKAFWRDGKELQDIVIRNQYEFTSEGWDWSMVLEDEDFYIDIVSGEKVHPCWVEKEDDHDQCSSIPIDEKASEFA